MFWCTNCPTGPCINASTNPTSFSTSDITKRINRNVRIPASLHTMNKKTLTPYLIIFLIFSFVSNQLICSNAGIVQDKTQEYIKHVKVQQKIIISSLRKIEDRVNAKYEPE